MAPSPQIFRQNMSPSPRDLLIPPLPTSYHFSPREIGMEAAGPFLPSSLPFLSTGCSDSPQAIGPLLLTTREKRGSRFSGHLLSIIGPRHGKH